METPWSGHSIGGISCGLVWVLSLGQASSSSQYRKPKEQQALQSSSPIALAGFSAMLSVFCYTEFTEIPVAGKLFVFSASLLLTDNNPILPFDQNPILETSKVQNPELQKQEEEVKIS